jgi:hypothetical protein
MMKKRNPAAVLLLPFVTLGIYCLYWLYATRKELVHRTGNKRSIPPLSFMFLPFIGLIALILLMFVISASTNGDSSVLTFVTIASFIIGMFGFLGLLAVPLWWFWRYCQVASDQTKGMDFAQMYVLYVVVSWVCGLVPVWMLIMQIEFNKMIDRDASQAHHHAPHHVEHHDAEHHHAEHPHVGHPAA